MKVLFLSPVFFPSRGGVETVVEQVAKTFSEKGHDVKVATETFSNQQDAFLFDLYRRPTGRELRLLFKWADIVWHHQLCLRQMGRSFQFPRKMGATFHTWLPTGGVSSVLRRALISKFAARYGVSGAIAAQLPNPTGVLPNSFDVTRFRLPESNSVRKWKFGYVGRLVSDKGVDLFLDAIEILHRSGSMVHCAIAGEGEEKERLMRRVAALNMIQFVEFLPWLGGTDLVEFYQNCEVCVIPSRWSEPFGLVALEAIACGAVVIAAESGGLPEAVGRCGLYFSRGDAGDLVDKMRILLRGGADKRLSFLCHRNTHLSQFLPEKQFDAYLNAFMQMLK